MKRHNGWGTVEMLIILTAPILLAIIFNDDAVNLLAKMLEAYLSRLGR